MSFKVTLFRAIFGIKKCPKKLFSIYGISSGVLGKVLSSLLFYTRYRELDI
jgi:hypothetical protein